MVVRLCTSPIFVFSVGKVNPRFPVVAQVAGGFFYGRLSSSCSCGGLGRQVAY